MTNPTYIAPGGRTFDTDGALSYKADVVASSGTIEAKAGHLLALISGAWTAYAVGTDATAQTGIQALGVLIEDASLSTTAVKCQVLYAGKVWEEFVRNAGILASVTSFEALIAAPGKLVFADAKEVD
jgi:hypothetical protein